MEDYGDGTFRLYLKWMFSDADWICVLYVSQAAGGSSGQAGVVKRRRPSEPLLNVFTFRIIGRDGKPKKRKVRHTTTWPLQWHIHRAWP